MGDNQFEHDGKVFLEVESQVPYSCDGCAFNGGDECLHPDEDSLFCGVSDVIFVEKQQ